MEYFWVFTILIALRYITTIASISTYVIYTFAYHFFVILGISACLSIFTTYIMPAKAPFSSLDQFKRIPFLSQQRRDARSRERAVYRPKQFIKSTKIQKSIDDILGFITRDFIQSWYLAYISTEAIFVNSFDRLLRYFIKSTSDRLIAVCTILLGHLQEYRRAERKLRGNRLQRNLTDPHEIEQELVHCYCGDGGDKSYIHPAVALTVAPELPFELPYLRNMSEKLLVVLLPQAEARSRLLLTVCREVLACKLLQPIVDQLSDPDNINQMIGVVTQKMSQDNSKSFERFMVEAGITEQQRAPQKNFEQEVGYFDDILVQVNVCDSLLDAFGLRDSIESEIMYRRAEISARDKIDKRIMIMGGKEKNIMDTSKAELILPFDAVMNEHTFISYFAEYLERNDRSHLLQVWAKLEALKVGSLIISRGDDAAQLYHDFIKITPVEISAEFKAKLDNISDKLRNSSENLEEVEGKQFLELQTAVYEIMQRDDYTAFMRTSLYNKFIKEKQVFDDLDSKRMQFSLGSPQNSFSTMRAIKPVESGGNISPTCSPSKERPSFDGDISGLETDLSTDDSIVKRTKNKIMDAKTRVLHKTRSTVGTKLDLTQQPPSLKKMGPFSDTSFFKIRKEKNPSISDLTCDLVPDEDKNKVSLVIPVKNPMSPTAKKKNRLNILTNRKSGSSSNLAAMSSLSPKLFAGTSDFNLSNLKTSASEDEMNERIKNTPSNLVSPSFFLSSGDDDSKLSSSGATSNTIKTASASILQDLMSVEDILPSFIPKPDTLVAQQAVILKCRAEIASIEFKLNETSGDGLIDRRSLSLMRTGLTVELSEAIKDKHVLEIGILSCIISEKTDISIPIYNEGKEFAVYSITIKDNIAKYGWIVSRRYSEFFDLHSLLKSRFPSTMAQIDLPAKTFLPKLKKPDDFHDSRRIALEKYLQRLVNYSEICKCLEFRRFICEVEINKAFDLILDADGDRGGGERTWRGFLHSFIHGGNDGENWLNRLKSVSPITNHVNSNTISIANWIKKGGNSIGSATGSGIDYDAAGVLVPEPESSRFDLSGEVSSTEIIADLFQEIFELKEKNNWLRRTTVLLLIQQVFGGTVERKVTGYVRWVFSNENVLYALDSLQRAFWPAGKWNIDLSARRTSSQIADSRAEAQSKLLHLMPELLGGVVGKQNARRGAERIFTVFQNKRLNQHLIFSLLDEVVAAVVHDIGV